MTGQKYSSTPTVNQRPADLKFTFYFGRPDDLVNGTDIGYHHFKWSIAESTSESYTTDYRNRICRVVIELS